MQVVRIDKKGRALDHVVHLSKRDNDDLIWVALGNGGPWKVTFDKAPTQPTLLSPAALLVRMSTKCRKGGS